MTMLRWWFEDDYDDPQDGSLEQFCEDNDNNSDLCAAVRALGVGERYYGGGGAAAAFVVVRMPDEE